MSERFSYLPPVVSGEWHNKENNDEKIPAPTHLLLDRGDTDTNDNDGNLEYDASGFFLLLNPPMMKKQSGRGDVGYLREVIGRGQRRGGMLYPTPFMSSLQQSSWR